MVQLKPGRRWENKMKKEFNLSDKEVYAPEVKTLGRTYEESLVIPKKDVKEFIKKLKEEICRYRDSCAKLYCDNCSVWNNINKLAGDKLNGK